MIKDGFLILCLNINIESRAPIVPPIRVVSNSLFSDTLEIFFEFFNASNLS